MLNSTLWSIQESHVIYPTNSYYSDSSPWGARLHEQSWGSMKSHVKADIVGNMQNTRWQGETVVLSLTVWIGKLVMHLAFFTFPLSVFPPSLPSFLFLQDFLKILRPKTRQAKRFRLQSEHWLLLQDHRTKDYSLLLPSKSHTSLVSTPYPHHHQTANGPSYKP